MIPSSDIINPKLRGKLIHCFKRLRHVAAIELRQGFNHSYDNILNFYLDRMDDSIYSGNINLTRYQRIRHISQNYVEYKIFYSFAHELEIKNELARNWDYILISEAEDIITAFENARYNFRRRAKDGNFCKIRDIEDLIEVEREEELCILELGELRSLLVS